LQIYSQCYQGKQPLRKNLNQLTKTSTMKSYKIIYKLAVLSTIINPLLFIADFISITTAFVLNYWTLAIVVIVFIMEQLQNWAEGGNDER